MTGHPSPSAPASGAPALPWQDPRVLGLNKEAPRAFFIAYPDAASALGAWGPDLPMADRRAASPWQQSLNGDWLFRHAPRVDARPDGFHARGFDDSAWGTIPVPLPWQMAGHDAPVYVNLMHRDDLCPWGRMDPPVVPADRNPVGCYRTRFTVPPAWRGRRVFIRFDGVESFFHLWINGAHVGHSKDSRTPAEFDITPHLDPAPGADNVLAAEVYRFSDASYLEIGRASCRERV